MRLLNDWWAAARRALWRLRTRRSDGAFEHSTGYWRDRYATGGDSGAGSYGRLARFKADVLNAFVAEHGVASVIEFGCGDGNQLALADYPRYLGLDVSRHAIARCRRRFAGNPTRRFARMKHYAGERADLALSLDVIYHLVEDAVFERYMRTLFGAARRFVIVYSSNTGETPPGEDPHVRHRRFTDWVEREAPAWRLLRHVPNEHPYDGDNRVGSHADFYVFGRDVPDSR